MLAGRFFFVFMLRNEKKVVFLQCQIVVRGREQFAFAAIFKLDLSDPHNEDITAKGYVLSFSIVSSIFCFAVSLSKAANTSGITTTALLL